MCVSGFVVVMINAEGQGPQVGIKANMHKKDDNYNGFITMYENVVICMIMSYNQIKN